MKVISAKVLMVYVTHPDQSYQTIQFISTNIILIYLFYCYHTKRYKIVCLNIYKGNIFTVKIQIDNNSIVNDMLFCELILIFHHASIY